MDEPPQTDRSHERWAHSRFSVIGPLLAASPARGELQQQLKELAAKKWRHPLSGAWIALSRSTIERRYYKALRATVSPVDVLQRKIRSDQGTHLAWSAPLSELLRQQHQQHPSWSYQLHADNLAVRVQAQPDLGSMPAYDSVRRFMKSQGLFKRPRRGPVHTATWNE